MAITPPIDYVNISTLPSPFGDRASVWCVDLDGHFKILNPGFLEPAEVSHAERMVRALDARRFLASRHALKTILARQLSCNPDEVLLRNSATGKPVVRGSPIEFSLSRSNRYALVACSTDQAIGADLEVLRPVPERDSLVAANFSAAEVQAMRLGPDTDQDRAFLEIWVRKEACLKATGLGLSLPLIEVAAGTTRERHEIRVSTIQGCWHIEIAPIEGPTTATAAVAIAHRY